MAGLFFTRKTKNGVNGANGSGVPTEADDLTSDSEAVYEPLPAPSLVDEPPDAIPGIPDLYSVLGVDPRSSDDIIRYAYRKKAAKLHDARWRPGRAARKLAELNAAYEILGKPDRRADYDRQRARLYYYQQAAREALAVEEEMFGVGNERPARPKRGMPTWLTAPKAPRGLLEAIAILGVVLVAIYAGYLIIGNSALFNLNRVRDAGASLGLPVRPAAAPTQVVAAQPVASPTPRTVFVPTVVVPTATVPPTPTTAPPKPTGAASVRTAARVSNPNPPRRSDLSVVLRVTRDSRPVPGIPVYLIAHYRTVDERFPQGDATVLTNDNGEATIAFNVGDATPGFQVNVDMFAVVDGETVQTQTAYTPR